MCKDVHDSPALAYPFNDKILHFPLELPSDYIYVVGIYFSNRISKVASKIKDSDFVPVIQKFSVSSSTLAVCIFSRTGSLNLLKSELVFPRISGAPRRSNFKNLFTLHLRYTYIFDAKESSQFVYVKWLSIARISLRGVLLLSSSRVCLNEFHQARKREDYVETSLRKHTLLGSRASFNRKGK